MYGVRETKQENGSETPETASGIDVKSHACLNVCTHTYRQAERRRRTRGSEQEAKETLRSTQRATAVRARGKRRNKRTKKKNKNARKRWSSSHGGCGSIQIHARYRHAARTLNHA